MGKYQLEIPLVSPFKKAEKNVLLQKILSDMEAKGIEDIKIKDVYYTEERAEFAPLTLVIIISTIADILTIALAIKEFLQKREPKRIREFHLRVDTKSVVIKGEMSVDDISKTLREARKEK